MSTAKLANFINGEFVTPKSGQYLENINPATDKLHNLVPDSDSRDVELAVEAASKAFKEWSKLHFSERALFLDKIADEMEKPDNFELLARADCNDMGKPIPMMKEMDMPLAIEHFRTYSRMIQSVTTPYYQMADAVAFEHRNAIGIVGLISPWNFPLYIFCGKIAAAIVCGNCCVCKPSEISPTSSYIMCKIFKSVGLPNGVINVIHGYGNKSGESIVKHEKVAAISFTGGTVTGSRISSIAAPMLKKLQLELGGKNPAIVFNDCYLDETVEGIAFSEFFNNGQVCASGSRLIIQEDIAPKFIEKLVSHIKQSYMKGIGDPLNAQTLLGPLSSKQHFEKVKSYLKLIKSEGGTIVFGGNYGQNSIECLNNLGNEFNNGYFIEPTIVTGLNIGARCACEEIFGPILTVHTFKTETEAMKMANDYVKYGLAATVWTSDIRRGQRIARELEAGIVWINCFGVMDSRSSFGGFKQSGVGRENGIHSIGFFSEIKSIVSKL